MIYLASPYTHVSAAIRNDRLLRTCVATAKLIKLGHIIFSPIVHSIPLVKFGELGSLWSDWITYNEEMMNLASCVAVLPLKGWEISNGVKHEVNYAVANNIPLAKVDLETYDMVSFDMDVVPNTIKEFWLHA